MRGACAWHPGFSLLEVAIALALLVMIAAMVLPAIGPRLDRRIGIEAQARVRTAIARAQADASALGESARVLAVGSDPQRLVSEPIVAIDPGAVGEAPEPTQTLLVELPLSCRVSATGSSDDLSEPEVFGAPRGETDTDGSVLIGWVLPDGTFEQAGEIRLQTPRGEESLTVDAWTARIVSAGGDAG
ncbi:MAG: type II secretion system protein [Phycisphaerales bacterium]